MPTASWWITLAILSIPHWLYAFVWTRSKQFTAIVTRMFGSDSKKDEDAKPTNKYSDPCEFFTAISGALKGVQFAALLCWYLAAAPAFSLSQVTALQWVATLALMGAGQVLNVGIYKAIGKAGVYYGTRLGRTIPWVSGFPFNVVRHPQYVGAVLTIWGLYALTLTAAHNAAGYLPLMLIWSLMYLPTALIESNL